MKTPQNHIYISAEPWFSTPEIGLEMTIACSHQNLGNLCFSSSDMQTSIYYHYLHACRTSDFYAKTTNNNIFVFLEYARLVLLQYLHVSLHIGIFRSNTSWRLWTLRDAPGRSWRLLEAPRGSWTLLEAGIERPRNEETAVFQRLVLWLLLRWLTHTIYGYHSEYYWQPCQYCDDCYY